MSFRRFLGLKGDPPLRSTRAAGPDRRPAHGDIILEEGLLTPSFPIDAVYTWVDGADPALGADLAAFPPRNGQFRSRPERFSDNDDLRYSLRSLAQYAPWVNHIFIVTNGQVPQWLQDSSKITIVRHDQILPPEYLPTFNSHVIESALHHIPGLSEHYLYLNDDVFLLRSMAKAEAFTANGLLYAFVTEDRLSPGGPQEGETATTAAAKNSRALIERKWGYAIDRRLAHTIQPQLKTVALECERSFADAYHRCRLNRHRGSDDILCCGYLTPVAAYFSQLGLFARQSYWYVLIKDEASKDLYPTLLRERSTAACRLSACFNDHHSKRDPEVFLNRYQEFLDRYYPDASPYEKTATE